MSTYTPFVMNTNGITKEPYPGSKSVEPLYSCLKVDGIQSIAGSSILSDEHHILFYSQSKGEDRQLSIVNHSTLKCQTFTSEELSKAAWPQSDWITLAAWHSGSVLLYNGLSDALYDDVSDSIYDGDVNPRVLKSFDIDLNKSSLCEGPDIKIPDDLRRFEISAICMDETHTYLAFDSKPRRILVFKRKRNENSLVARLAAPAPADPVKYDHISDIVVRKDRIAAATGIGHIAMWDRQLSVSGSKNNVDIPPCWTTTKVDSLNLDLEFLISKVLMSQDCESVVVLDPLWCENAAYITPSSEAVQTILAREYEPIGDSLLRVDEDCRIAAVGVEPVGFKDPTTPQLKIFELNKNKLPMTFPPFGLCFSEAVGEFLDFSLEESSIKYYGTKGIISVDFGEEGSMSDDSYTCSRGIPLNPLCSKDMRTGKVDISDTALAA